MPLPPSVPYLTVNSLTGLCVLWVDGKISREMRSPAKAVAALVAAQKAAVGIDAQVWRGSQPVKTDNVPVMDVDVAIRRFQARYPGARVYVDPCDERKVLVILPEKVTA